MIMNAGCPAKFFFVCFDFSNKLKVSKIHIEIPYRWHMWTPMVYVLQSLRESD